MGPNFWKSIDVRMVPINDNNINKVKFELQLR